MAAIGCGHAAGHQSSDDAPGTLGTTVSQARNMSTPDGGGTPELDAPAEEVNSWGPGTSTPKLPLPLPLKPGWDLDVVFKTATRELVAAGWLRASSGGGGGGKGTLAGRVLGAERIPTDFGPCGPGRREARDAPPLGAGGGGGGVFARVLGAG